MKPAEIAPAFGKRRLGNLDHEPRFDAGTGAEMGRQHGQPFRILQGLLRNRQGKMLVRMVLEMVCG